MISDETITQAIARGIITSEQAKQIRTLESADTPPQDNEKLRFITGVGDIFVAIGLVLFLGAIGYFLSQWTVPAIGVGLAVACWGWLSFSPASAVWPYQACFY